MNNERFITDGEIIIDRNMNKTYHLVNKEDANICCDLLNKIIKEAEYNE